MLVTGEVADKADTITAITFFLGILSARHAFLMPMIPQKRRLAFFLATAQAALGAIQNDAEALASNLMTAAQSGTGRKLNVASQSAQDTFRTIVGNLNASAAGRSVFAGSGADRAALADADAMFGALAAALTGQTTATGVRAEIEAWFMDAGGGFETVGYIGETDPLAPFQLNRETSAGYELRADRDEIRAVLIEVATAAFATDEAFGLSQSAQQSLLQDAGEGLLARLDGVTELRAEIGALEERVELAGVRNAATRASLELTRADLFGADPYDTATRLESTRTQLEMLYSVTSRLSNLTLANYLG